MEEINNLLKLLFCFILTSHIMKFDSRLTGYIDLGIALSKLHGIAESASAHFFHQHSGQNLSNCDKNSNLDHYQNNLIKQ